jgi:hypothetical protein
VPTTPEAATSNAGTREEFARRRGTFRFVANDSDPLVKCRAEWTIEVLDLNKRLLTRARESVYFFIESALRRYALEKAQGSPAAVLRRTKAQILGPSHPTVFLEMQRSPVADLVFQSISEARTWRLELRP